MNRRAGRHSAEKPIFSRSSIENGTHGSAARCDQLADETAVENGARRKIDARSNGQMRIQHRQSIGVVERQHEPGAVVAGQFEELGDRGRVGRQRIG